VKLGGENLSKNPAENAEGGMGHRRGTSTVMEQKDHIRGGSRKGTARGEEKGNHSKSRGRNEKQQGMASRATICKLQPPKAQCQAPKFRETARKSLLKKATIQRGTATRKQIRG